MEQKVEVKWVEEWDNNTKSFYPFINGRKINQVLNKLEKEGGDSLGEERDLEILWEVNSKRVELGTSNPTNEVILGQRPTVFSMFPSSQVKGPSFFVGHPKLEVRFVKSMYQIS